MRQRLLDVDQQSRQVFYHCFQPAQQTKQLEELGFEPRTFCMRSRRSTTELHPLTTVFSKRGGC